ncbi:splicing factor ESS-2 homolog isoform X2 [Phymastichus coffea]|uniref:splicing factor ESS-2 homolog isoform X2 n=1 Tax=Phymastichus coffea TaxID=108790 RepID=UPI00273A9ABB|nr:splicing factor ESS-2 homolog isoform X2 [Phymastichus coffea]
MVSSIESSPGRMALEAAKNIKDLAVFKTPIGPAKRRKCKILDEETYVEKIGEIIQRDFFPDLEKLKAQNEYMLALENNDTKKMRELYEKYSLVRPATERLASPATFETPVRTENSNEDTVKSTTSTNKEKQSKDLQLNEKKVGLDEFLSNNTSEDNASFEEIIVENEKRHRLKNAWLYKPETEPTLNAIENNKNESLAIENDNKKRPFETDTWSYKNKNYIMYIPDGVELTLDEKIELAKKKQEVVHSNTRLKFNPFNEQQNKETINELAKVQSKANDGKIGIDGKEIVRNETPRVNGYSIVASPAPSIPESIMDSPIMTWGQIEGTPFRLDGGDTPLLHSSGGPSFRMAEPPKREKIAMQLAEKAGERLRDKKIKALNVARRSLATPSPRSSIDRLNTMSPAAKTLATQKLRIAISPSPSRTLLSTPVMRVKTPSTPRLLTPMIKSNKPDSIPKTQSPVLTDNLLKLPRRQRAADFF